VLLGAPGLIIHQFVAFIWESRRLLRGKYVVEMTGGTNPSSKVYPEFSKAGFSTMIEMHMKEDAIQKANEANMNVIITGHMASDSLGMNLFLDELEMKGIEIIPCGGLIRVSRISKKKK
jgi:putative NIF3 family GTP cyclohydrolase 1 type 2